MRNNSRVCGPWTVPLDGPARVETHSASRARLASVPDDTTDEAALPPGVGLDVAVDPEGEEFPADERRRVFLRQVADELRGDSSESRQLAAILYRVSDLYDPDEDTSPEEIYLNTRNIMQVKANGGLDR